MPGRFREIRTGKLAVRLSVRVRVLDALATYNNNIIHLLFMGKKETTNNLVNSVIDPVGVRDRLFTKKNNMKMVMSKV